MIEFDPAPEDGAQGEELLDAAIHELGVARSAIDTHRRREDGHVRRRQQRLGERGGRMIAIVEGFEVPAAQIEAL